MSEPKSEPWEVVESIDLPHCDLCETDHVQVSQVFFRFNDEQGLVCCFDCLTTDEQRHVLRLLAAAPGLLEACEDAMEAFRKNLAMAAYKNEHVMLDSFRKCEDAVAKAKWED